MKTNIELIRAIMDTSDDPDTKVAAYVTDTQWSAPLVCASNSMPPLVEKKSERLQRPLKYSFINHAERKLIAQAARDGVALNGTILVLNWFPCDQCALSIAEAGIKEVVVSLAAYMARKDDPRYGFKAARETLIESGVQITYETYE